MKPFKFYKYPHTCIFEVKKIGHYKAETPSLTHTVLTRLTIGNQHGSLCYLIKSAIHETV